MSTCGLWRTPRRYVAVVVDEQGRRCKPISVATTAEATWGLLVWLQARGGVGVVITEAVHSDSAVAAQARELGVPTWVAPDDWVDAVMRVSSLRSVRARRCAEILARWPRVPKLLLQLRPAGAPLEPGTQQLRLL